MKNVIKYSLFFALSAVIANCEADHVSSTTGAHPVATLASESKVDKCLALCDPADVSCRASCVGVPNPNKEQIAATNHCVAQCNSTSNQANIECQGSCIKRYFQSISLSHLQPTSISSSIHTSSPSPSSDASSSSQSSNSGHSTSTDRSKSGANAEATSIHKDKSNSASNLMISSMVVAGALSVALAMI